jgi:pyruvate/2-oxoglutarate/acetoin dehydrogenase E1 component
MTSVLDSLNAGLHRAFSDDQRVLLLGEDVLDPYGGAFKVSRGLSTAFPGRVLTSPVSEAGMVGVAAGMAMRGLRPIVEIMFGDFLTLAADQLINHVSKFRWMYNDQVKVPIVVRTPMGGRRGYGPTHSQTLEKLFMGIPGLHIIAPSSFGDPGQLLYHAIIEQDDPVLFIENKLLYLLKIPDYVSDPDFDVRQIPLPIEQGQTAGSQGFIVNVRSAPPAVLSLATYGYPAELARQAALQLAYEQEIFIEILVFTQLAPFELSGLFDSLGRTHRLLTLEEGTGSLGWGAEITARAAKACGSIMLSSDRVAALDFPVPSSGPLEDRVLPDVDRIIQSCQNLIQKR